MKKALIALAARFLRHCGFHVLTDEEIILHLLRPPNENNGPFWQMEPVITDQASRFGIAYGTTRSVLADLVHHNHIEIRYQQGDIRWYAIPHLRKDYDLRPPRPLTTTRQP